MNLKTYFRFQLIDIMEKLEKTQTDIHKNTTHNAGYVCKFLKEDTNHSLDTIEQIANALGCYVVIRFVQKPGTGQINILVQ